MAKARGISKVIAYAKEASFGELAPVGSGKQLRRTSADFTSTRESYESEEIRTDQQVADFRLGTRSSEGSIAGELSGGSYSELIQAVLARDFTVGGVAALVDFDIAQSGFLWTLTRSTGDWLTNFKVGDVVRISVAGDAANQDNNLIVVGLTALVMTVRAVSATKLVPESITGATVKAVGKKTYVPKTAHTSDSFTVEEWYSDIQQSEVHSGVKIGSWSVTVPASGLVTTDFSAMGQGLKKTDTVQYFTSPAPLTTTGVVAAVNGAVIINGSATNACVTDFNFSVERAQEASQCIGSEIAETIFDGTIRVTGSMSIYFENGYLRDQFEKEETVSFVLALSSGSQKDADVMTFVLPKAKLSSFSKSDAELGIMASCDFTAILNDVTTGGLIDSTIMVTDTTLV